MSVLIKGMTMPKCCEDCPLGEESDSLYYSCYPQGLDYTHDSKSGRMPNCPLIEVPPHGRLVDADAYHKEIRERYESAREWYNEAEDDEIIGRAEATMITFTECSLTLQNMPTIIGAEGE